MFDLDYYLHSGSGIFALVLSEKIGGEIWTLSNKINDNFSTIIPYDVTHIVVVKNDEYFDAKGRRSLKLIAKDFALSSRDLEHNGPIDPDEFKKRFTGRGDRYPRDSVTILSRKECEKYIVQHIKLFM